MTEDEVVGWHHRLDGCEFEQALADGEGQGALACCSPWGRKGSDSTEQLNNNNKLCPVAQLFEPRFSKLRKADSCALPGNQFKG